MVFHIMFVLQAENELMPHKIEMRRAMAVMTMIAKAQSSVLRNS